MKLTSQMPSSTSLMPSFWPASTVEMLNFLRCRQKATASRHLRSSFAPEDAPTHCPEEPRRTSLTMGGAQNPGEQEPSAVGAGFVPAAPLGEGPMSINPVSTAKVGSHPLHPMLIPFPVAFLVAAFVTDLAFIGTGDGFWARASMWLIGAGI